VVSATPRPFYTRKCPGTHWRGLCGSQRRSGRVWANRNFLAHAGDGTPVLSVRSESLSQPFVTVDVDFNIIFSSDFVP
jgi:hypothetical protein